MDRILRETVARACIASINRSLGGRIRSVRNATAEEMLRIQSVRNATAEEMLLFSMRRGQKGRYECE